MYPFISILHNIIFKRHNFIFSPIERFWRSAKVERIYLNEYNTIKELKNDVSDYIDFYNHKRFHQTLGYKKPMSFYYDILKINNKDYDNLVEIGA